MTDQAAERKKEAAVIRRRTEDVYRIGLGVIKGSCLQSNEELREDCIGDTLALVSRLEAYNGHNRALHSHHMLAHEFAGRIITAFAAKGSVILSSDQAYAIRIGALIHDIGRYVTHRFRINDIVGEQLLRRWHIRREIISVMPSLSKIDSDFDLSEKNIQAYFDSLSFGQRIVILSDLCGNRVTSGKGGLPTKQIRTFDEVMKYHYESADYSAYWGRKDLWPNEKKSLSYTPFTAALFYKIRDWASQNGADVEAIRLMILQDEKMSG